MTVSAGDVAFYAAVLILPVASLVARRLPVSATIKMALAWAAIFAVAFGLVLLWQEAAGEGLSFGSAT